MVDTLIDLARLRLAADPEAGLQLARRAAQLARRPQVGRLENLAKSLYEHHHAEQAVLTIQRALDIMAVDTDEQANATKSRLHANLANYMPPPHL